MIHQQIVKRAICSGRFFERVRGDARPFAGNLHEHAMGRRGQAEKRREARRSFVADRADLDAGAVFHHRHGRQHAVVGEINENHRGAGFVEDFA